MEHGKTRIPVALNVQLSQMHGWGVLGLNLVLQWYMDDEISMFGLDNSRSGLLQLDSVRGKIVNSFLDASDHVIAGLQSMPGTTLTLKCILIQPLHELLVNDFLHRRFEPLKKSIRSDQMIGMPFLTDSTFTSECRERSRMYQAVVAGSTWNRNILDSWGVENAVLVLQGVDTNIFCPGASSGRFSNRFVVFSGGKLEFRKGQDIVLRAMKVFIDRHPDVILVTAWNSPWPAVSGEFDQVDGVDASSLVDSNARSLTRFAVANGIPDSNFYDAGVVPNTLLPELLREADVALFPNRCEGGTNLVAMEAMACGIPTILSANTGHLDLISDERCFPLRCQSAVRGSRDCGRSFDGWGESDVDEILQVLEDAYEDRMRAEKIGENAASFMKSLDWSRQAQKLKQVALGRPLHA